MLFLRLLLLSVAMGALAGCVQPPKKQAFNREASGHITTVTLARAQNQDEYEAAVIGHPASSFGLIGGLIAAADTSAKTARLTKSIDPAQVRAQERLAERLSAALRESGYRVTVTALSKDTPESGAFEAAKRTGAADAVILIQLRAGYWAAGPYTDYLPRIVANVRKIDFASGNVLYEDTITYGYASPGQPTVHLASRPEFRFASIEALEADPAKARLGLLEGLEAIAGQITADLKK
jgi:hypothetical protein